jgi:hypothetical protein
MKSLGKTILPYIKRVSHRNEFRDACLLSDWGTIMGPPWGEQCVPKSVVFSTPQRINGTVYIRTQPAYATFVMYAQTSLLERINRFYGYNAVTRMIVSHDLVPPLPPKALPQISTVPPIHKNLSTDLHQALENLWYSLAS